MVGLIIRRNNLVLLYVLSFLQIKYMYLIWHSLIFFEELYSNVRSRISW